MTEKLEPKEFVELIGRLRKLPAEKEWIEFKENWFEPVRLAEYISGLSNSAVLRGEPTAFMVWGIRDTDHSLVGTSFDPWTEKKGNEDLIPWLKRMISPGVDFRFQREIVDGHRVVLLRVPAASRLPVKFKKQGFVRVESQLKALSDQPELEKQLFRALDSYSFEEELAKSFLDENEVLSQLNYPEYFRKTEISLPDGRDGILKHLEAARLVTKSVEKKWSITNLGALVYANDLSHFPDLKRRACRIIVYEDTGRLNTIRERTQQGGYVPEFELLVRYIVDALPAREVIEDNGLRTNHQLVPTIVIRELLANAIMHQDLLERSTALMVEIFSDRVEFLNPGKPLVDPLRFIDTPSKTRNPKLADALRRGSIVEEKGSGWDKITSALEEHALPPSKTETDSGYTKVTVFGHRDLSHMNLEERVAAVYQHACLNYVMHVDTNNQSVRRRFQLSESAKSKASRLLREAKEAGMIMEFDSKVGVRSLRYVPFWAETKD